MSTAPQQVVNIPAPQASARKLRFVTAASLFDGHDAAINIMRRILQSSGAEVIHLGHNRSVAEIVNAAVQEDVHAIALSSYQGGHVEYLKYMVDMLKAQGRPDIRIFAGGGGVIIPDEIRELETYGVTRIYSPEDGQKMGLQGLITDMLERCKYDPAENAPDSLEALAGHDTAALASLITALENHRVSDTLRAQIRQQSATRAIPVLGITGTGGSGKSSLTDEIIRRFRLDHDDQLQDRHHRRRSDAAQDRWLTARRSHPHECHRPPQYLHALDRHTRLGRRNSRGRRRRDGGLQAVRIRLHHRRNARHRPG